MSKQVAFTYQLNFHLIFKTCFGWSGVGGQFNVAPQVHSTDKIITIWHTWHTLHCKSLTKNSMMNKFQINISRRKKRLPQDLKRCDGLQDKAQPLSLFIKTRLLFKLLSERKRGNKDFLQLIEYTQHHVIQ